VAAVLFDSLLLRTLLGDMSLFMAIVAEVVATSALQEGTLNWTSMMGGQGHPILGGHHHWGVCNMGITQLLHHPQ